jgi:hypothetical protein
MPNTLANPTMGFQSFRRTEGGSPTAGLTEVWIASTDAGLFFRGDPVVTSSAPGTNNSGAYITSYNTLAAAASTTFIVRGVFQGCYQYQPTAGRVIWSNSYLGAVTGSTGDVKAYIIDDPSEQFLVQGSTVAAITSSYVGLNIGVTFNTTTGSQLSGYSNITLSAATAGSSYDLPFRIVDFYSAYAAPGIPAIGASNFINGTDNTAAANMVIVRLNNCDRLSLTARSS